MTSNVNSSIGREPGGAAKGTMGKVVRGSVKAVSSAVPRGFVPVQILAVASVTTSTTEGATSPTLSWPRAVPRATQQSPGGPRSDYCNVQ